jgi:hypothetical protein
MSNPFFKMPPPVYSGKKTLDPGMTGIPMGYQVFQQPSPQAQVSFSSSFIDTTIKYLTEENLKMINEREKTSQEIKELDRQIFSIMNGLIRVKVKIENLIKSEYSDPIQISTAEDIETLLIPLYTQLNL